MMETIKSGGRRRRSLSTLLLVNALALALVAGLLLSVQDPVASQPAAGPDAITAAELALLPVDPTILISDTITINIVASGISDLYGLELDLAFDPALLTVVDDNPGLAGVQITPGSCPQATFVAQNTADNTAGTISYAATSLAPVEPCTGGGTVATMTFQGVAQGTTPITFTSWLLSDSNIQPITTTVTNGSITVQERPGLIQGNLSLQGRTDSGGVLIEARAVNGSLVTSTVSGSDGSYALSLPPDSYTVTVEMAGYLDAERAGVLLDADTLVALPSLTLPCGDANDDDLVNIQDLSLLGSHYRFVCEDPGWDARADMVNDCIVNILDLTCSGANFNRTSPVSWP